MKRKNFVNGILVFFFLIFWSFWVYRYGVVAFPRQDHFSFMIDRALFQNDWDYFWHFVSFNKTRTTFQGDYYLFRPALHGLLAVLDIFFRHNLYVIGALSIVWHALASFFLYLFASKLTSKKIGFLLTLIFSTQYPGLEMIVWRHVSPYMFALLFFACGLMMIMKLEKSKHPKRVLAATAVLFFISSLFFEAIIFVLLSSIFLFLAFLRNSKNGKKTNIESLMLVVSGAVVVVFLCLYGLDYAVRKPPAFLGSADIQRESFVSINMLYNFCSVSGLVFTSFFLPHIVNIVYPSVWYRAWWEFQATAGDFFYCWLGAFLNLVLIGSFFLGLIYLFRKKNKTLLVVYVLTFVYFGAVVAGLAVGRVNLRSIDYMLNATYYYYITSYLLTMIAALLVCLANESLRIQDFLKPWIWFVVILFTVHQTSLSYGRIQDVLKTRHDFDQKVAEATLEVATAIKNNQRFCYGGSINPLLSDYLFNDLLYRQLCLNTEKVRLYAFTDSGGTTWLSKLKNIDSEEAPLNLKAGNFEEKDGLIYSLNPSSQLKEGQGVVLSQKDYNVEYLSAAIHHAFGAGIILGYQDSGNFMILVVKQGTFSVQVMQNGALSPPFYAQSIKPADQFELSIRKIGVDYVVFYNQNVLAVIKGGFQLKGKVGLCDFKSGTKRQAFSHLKVSDVQSGYKVENVLELLFKLKMPHLQDLVGSNEGWAVASNRPLP